MATDTHFHVQTGARLAFFKGFLREPQRVGSVIPSSRYLERRVVSLAGVRNARTVVELGPGTGGITGEVLRQLPRSATLIAIELDPRFVSILKRNSDQRLLVHHGNAGDLREILDQYGLPSPQAVISGIPFSFMQHDLSSRIVQAIHTVLSVGGRFVTYQLRNRVTELGCPLFGPAEVVREFRNIPPLRIYRWQKAGG
jgi:phospholipid N-methyltransferase